MSPTGSSDAVADKLRAYGRPYPLTINGEIVAWLVPDDAIATRVKAKANDAVIYTAAEISFVSTLPAEDVRRLHHFKAALGGTLGPDDETLP